MLSNRLGNYLYQNFSYTCIYTERLLRMAKKEKQKFYQYRAERGSQRGSQIISTSSPSASLVALF